MQMNFPFVVVRVNRIASYICSSFGMKFISSQYTMFSVGPLIVSGLFGKASIRLLFVRWIVVFCGLWWRFFGSLWRKVLILRMMNFVCLQLGPTTAMWVFLFLSAYHRSRAEMMWDFPDCLHHRAAVNCLFWNSLIRFFWYFVGWNLSISWQNWIGSFGIFVFLVAMAVLIVFSSVSISRCFVLE